MKRKFKPGDRAVITKNSHCHEFDIGDGVEIQSNGFGEFYNVFRLHGGGIKTISPTQVYEDDMEKLVTNPRLKSMGFVG